MQSIQCHFKTFLCAVIFLGCYFTAGAQIQIGPDILGDAYYDYSGTSVSMPNATTLAIGSPGSDSAAMAAGQVRIFTWNGNSWVKKGSDIFGGFNSGFGNAVSMPDVNTLGVAASNGSGVLSQSGIVRIFTWDGSDWIQKGSEIEGEATNDHSGISMDMPDANTVAIGSVYNQANGGWSGHVRIYSWDGTDWIQKGIDIDGDYNSSSGSAVSMPNANTVAIGARNSSVNGLGAGEVRVFIWLPNGTWVQKGSTMYGEAAGDNSGASVSMPDVNTVAIGAPDNDGNGNFAGQVRIYRWVGGNWVQKGSDIDGEGSQNSFGSSVSMPDSNTLAVGARRAGGVNGFGTGHARVFTWNGIEWVQKGIDIDGEALNDYFGTSICMPDSNIVAVGAPGNATTAAWAGHVRVYTFGNIPSGLNQAAGNAENTLVVYPNPTKGNLTVDLRESISEVTVIIRNETGKEVRRQKFRNSASLHVSIPGAAGVYFVELIAGNKVTSVKVAKE